MEHICQVRFTSEEMRVLENLATKRGVNVIQLIQWAAVHREARCQSLEAALREAAEALGRREVGDMSRADWKAYDGARAALEQGT